MRRWPGWRVWPPRHAPPRAPLEITSGGFDPADELDDDIDLRGRDDLQPIGPQQSWGHGDLAGPVRTRHRHASDGHRTPDGPGDGIAVLQQPVDLGTDGPQAEQPNSDRPLIPHRYGFGDGLPRRSRRTTCGS